MRSPQNEFIVKVETENTGTAHELDGGQLVTLGAS
jgi:hypothetical protein